MGLTSTHFQDYVQWIDVVSIISPSIRLFVVFAPVLEFDDQSICDYLSRNPQASYVDNIIILAPEYDNSTTSMSSVVLTGTFLGLNLL